jgi:hypothetical protein
MKNKFNISILIIGLLGFASCDKGFKTLNIDPNNPTTINATYLFTNAQISTYSPKMESEATIVQQFINPFGGVTSAFNYNLLNRGFTDSPWNTIYPGSVELLTQVLSQTKDNPAQVNLYNEARIWKAYQFMLLVDTYGDVPYSEAGLAYFTNNFFPKYDNQQSIYTDLVNELTAATAALDPTKDIETADAFYHGNIAQWKKLGYSLLLRVGMRYSKFNATTAKSIVQTAVAGGVMQSNSDNCYLTYNNAYSNPLMSLVQALTNTFYLAEPFITQLKSTKDPRLKYISAKYSDAGNAVNLTPDTVTANQYGMPIGYDNGSLPTAPGYKGTAGTGFNYSQLNYNVIARLSAPLFFVTYAQTQLLLAEAAYRGWISGSAINYYNVGVTADMDRYATYLPSATISGNEKTSYLASSPVSYNDANALNLINTQYWIASFGNGSESWANFRRSGFPALSPNKYPGRQIKGNFVRRFVYPLLEQSANAANYNAAVASIGGPDDLETPVFWDK